MEKVDLVIKGATSYFANVSDSPLGTIRSVEHTVQSFEQVGNNCAASMQATQKRLIALNEQIDQPFEYTDELAEKLKRQQSLIEQLDLNKNQAANTLDANQEAAEVSEYSETVSQNTSIKRERGIQVRKEPIMQYYRVNVDKEETVSWTPKYEPLIRKLRPLVRARAGLMPWALSQFRIEVQPTKLDGGEVLILGRADEPCVIPGWPGTSRGNQRPGTAWSPFTLSGPTATLCPRTLCQRSRQHCRG